MASPRPPTPLLLVVAAFSKYATVLTSAADLLEAEFGPIGLASIPYDFVQTRYYEPAMGTNLRKCFFAFERLVDPSRLPAIKLLTNELETRVANDGTHDVERPLNLDPGLLALGKFMLATTKDQAHRIYLRDGIFAEVTLRFQAGSFEPWPWTYADYQTPFVREFLGCARDYYRGRLRDSADT